MQPRKPASKQLEGLEIAWNGNWFQSVFLGLERGLFRAPTSFLTTFAMPFVVMILALAVIVVGIPMWILIHFGYVLIGLLGYLRREPVVPHHQSVVN